MTYERESNVFVLLRKVVVEIYIYIFNDDPHSRTPSPNALSMDHQHGTTKIYIHYLSIEQFYYTVWFGAEEIFDCSIMHTSRNEPSRDSRFHAFRTQCCKVEVLHHAVPLKKLLVTDFRHHFRANISLPNLRIQSARSVSP